MVFIFTSVEEDDPAIILETISRNIQISTSELVFTWIHFRLKSFISLTPIDRRGIRIWKATGSYKQILFVC